MYIYIKHQGEALYTVGFYTPQGVWEPESDHSTIAEAAARVHYLNGGNSDALIRENQRLCNILSKIENTLNKRK